MALSTLTPTQRQRLATLLASDIAARTASTWLEDAARFFITLLLKSRADQIAYFRGLVAAARALDTNRQLAVSTERTAEDTRLAADISDLDVLDTELST